MEAVDFGAYLRILRKQRKLTTRQVELYAGVSNAYLSQVETGKRGKPSPAILQKLAPVLHVSYEELMEKAGYLNSNSDDIKPNQPEDPEQEFIKWVKENVSSSFFYDFDADPEESKAQLMRDLKYMWERERKKK